MAVTATEQQDLNSPTGIAAQHVRPSALVLLIATVGSGDAFAQVLSLLPRELSFSIVCVTDVRKGFSTLLCERLAGECALPVREINGDCFLRAGEVFVLPSQSRAEFVAADPTTPVVLKGLPVVDAGGISLPRIRSTCASAVKIFGPRTLAVVLSALCGDPVDGATQVAEAGGRVLVQQPESALVAEGNVQALTLRPDAEALPAFSVAGRVVELLSKT